MSARLLFAMTLASLILPGCGTGALGELAPKMPMQCALLRSEADLYVYSCQGMGGVNTLTFADEDGKVDHWCVESATNAGGCQ